jgi:PST family polysaccharide transporter
MLSFSIWSLFEQLTIWITTYADSFIISHFLSAYYVGLYKQPYQLITNIYSVFTASVFAILFSALSRFNDDGDTLSYKTVLFNTQKFLSVLIVPMGVGIYMYREFITNILLGNKWNDAAIVIGCFALEKIIQILMNNPASEIYRSKGKPFVSVIAQLLFLIVLIPACVISLRQNFEIFVYVRAAMCLVFMVIHLVLVYMNFKINMLEVIPKMISVLVSAGVMLSIGYLLKKLLSEYFWFGFIKILICALIYSVCLLCFKDTRTIISECYYKFVMKRQTGDQL